jgi:hypothetical protein
MKLCLVLKYIALTLISGFRRDVDDICTLLGYYAASCGNCLSTFRDNVSVPSSRIKRSLIYHLLKVRHDGELFNWCCKSALKFVR